MEASKPFNLPAASSDVYWNFVFTPNVDTRKWVRAIEIRPGDRRLVHHANLYVDRAARTMHTRGDGFPGMDFVIERPVGEPDDGHFLYWKPGGIPYSEPDGFAWRLGSGQRSAAERAPAAQRKTRAGASANRPVLYKSSADALSDAGAT